MDAAKEKGSIKATHLFLEARINSYGNCPQCPVVMGQTGFGPLGREASDLKSK